MKKQTAKRKTEADREKHNKPPSEEAIRRHMLKRDNCQERADMAPGVRYAALGVEIGDVTDADLITAIEAVLGEGAVKIILDAPPSDPALLGEETDVMFVKLSVGQKPPEITEPGA